MNDAPLNFKMVKFINIQDYVINFDNPGRITVDFIVDRKIKVTGNDWVAIFPEGCDSSSPNCIDLIVTYEFMLGPPVNKEENMYRMQFSLKKAKNLHNGRTYHFIYHHSHFEILGISSVFKFMDSRCKEISPYIVPKKNHALPVQPCNNNTKECLEKESLKNKNERNHRRTPSLPVQEKKLLRRHNTDDTDGADFTNVIGRGKSHSNNKSRRNKPGFENKVQPEAIYGSPSTTKPVPSCKPYTTTCPNCQQLSSRIGNLLNLQTEHYSQIKNLAERNSDLEMQVEHLRKQVELGQAAYQKLSVNLMHERQLTQLYQAGAGHNKVEHQYQIAWYYQQVVVGHDNFQQPIYAIHPVMQCAPLITQQVLVLEQPAQAYLTIGGPPKNEFHRLEDKPKVGSMLKLKAIIGSQEEKIRMLSERITELQAQYNDSPPAEVQKVKAVVKDLEKLHCTDQHFNNNDGETVENWED